jgi:hypothetical protein
LKMWVAKLGRWVAKLGRWVTKSGRWRGRWVAKVVALLIAMAALWVLGHLSTIQNGNTSKGVANTL